MCAPQMTKLQPQDFIFKSFNFCTMASIPSEPLPTSRPEANSGAEHSSRTGPATEPLPGAESLSSLFPSPPAHQGRGSVLLDTSGAAAGAGRGGVRVEGGRKRVPGEHGQGSWAGPSAPGPLLLLPGAGRSPDGELPPVTSSWESRGPGAGGQAWGERWGGGRRSPSKQHSPRAARRTGNSRSRTR